MIFVVFQSIRELNYCVFQYIALNRVALHVNLGYYEDVSTLALRVLINVMKNKLCY